MTKKKDELLEFAHDLSNAFAQLSEVDRSDLDYWFTQRDQDAWEEFDNERWTAASLKQMEEKNEKV